MLFNALLYAVFNIDAAVEFDGTTLAFLLDVSDFTNKNALLTHYAIIDRNTFKPKIYILKFKDSGHRKNKALYSTWSRCIPWGKCNIH